MKEGMNKVAERIKDFIADFVESSGVDGVIVGVSGGVDSATVAFLCADALGSDRVLALIMPEKGVTPEKDVEDAIEVCKIKGIDYKLIEINTFLEPFFSILGDSESIAAANIKPRVRMILNYYHANKTNRLVAGTGNRSELMVGYFTKYGDGGVDFLPIGDLYKTEVLELARYLGVPEEIVTKKPSARLWTGQTDEDEMGISYSELDAVLKALDKGMDATQISSSTGVELEKVRKVLKMVEESRHKREMPPVANVRDLIQN
jgi:NAD+ synthase